MAPRGVREHLRALHYDTALRMHPVGMTSALQLVDASHLLLGTDAPLRKSVDQLAELHACGLAEDVVRKIEAENARALLDRYRAVTP
jgi:predicted TIM-barrel fold metal-dependent hydrolase